MSLSLVLALKPNNAQQINEKVSNTVKLNLDYLSKCTVKMMWEGSPGTMGQKVKRRKLTLLGCTGPWNSLCNTDWLLDRTQSWVVPEGGQINGTQVEASQVQIPVLTRIFDAESSFKITLSNGQYYV